MKQNKAKQSKIKKYTKIIIIKEYNGNNNKLCKGEGKRNMKKKELKELK